MKLTFQTDLNVDECINRLKNAIGKEGFSWSSLFKDEEFKEVVGRVKNKDFRLFRKRKNFNTSFAPFFYGKFIQEEKRTRIEGHFGMHPRVKAFMAIWILMAIYFTLFIFFKAAPSVRSMALQNSLAIFVIGIAFLAFGKWFGKNDEEYMTNFIQETLLARKEIMGAQ